MILDIYVETTLSATTVKKYLELGYDIPTHVDAKGRVKSFYRGQKIKVLVAHLDKSSNVIVTAKCTYCEKIRKLQYGQYSERCSDCNLRLRNGTLEDQIKKFWSRVEKTETCWIYKAQLGSHGYGQFTVKSKARSSHTFSWNLHYGEIPKKLYVLHKCDNRACVNPDHLFLGTQQDNMNDMVSKNRSLKGSQVKSSKLTENQVIDILEELKIGTSNKQIAVKYGVDPSLISMIKLRKIWRHI